jgi:hypothetical protein
MPSVFSRRLTLRVLRACAAWAIVLSAANGRCADPVAESLPPVRAITKGPKFHWFGCYDKHRFDPTDRYVLGNEVAFEHRAPLADNAINVGMVDPADGDRWIELGQSRAWSWRQGCMFEWLPGGESTVVWNDREDAPTDTSGGAKLIVTLADAARIDYAGGFPHGAKHWFNHLLISPDGKRLIFLHRWRGDGQRGFSHRADQLAAYLSPSFALFAGIGDRRGVRLCRGGEEVFEESDGFLTTGASRRPRRNVFAQTDAKVFARTDAPESRQHVSERFMRFSWIPRALERTVMSMRRWPRRSRRRTAVRSTGTRPTPTRRATTARRRRNDEKPTGAARRPRPPASSMRVTVRRLANSQPVTIVSKLANDGAVIAMARSCNNTANELTVVL